ncbi:MAG: fibronectin type III domain-containing protein [Anaerostipes hadrus]
MPKESKTKTISKNKTTSYTIKKLKKKKTYYVRIRTYKKVSGKTYYSEWSSMKKVKIKK